MERLGRIQITPREVSACKEVGIVVSPDDALATEGISDELVAGVPLPPFLYAADWLARPKPASNAAETKSKSLFLYRRLKQAMIPRSRGLTPTHNWEIASECVLGRTPVPRKRRSCPKQGRRRAWWHHRHAGALIGLVVFREGGATPSWQRKETRTPIARSSHDAKRRAPMTPLYQLQREKRKRRSEEKDSTFTNDAPSLS